MKPYQWLALAAGVVGMLIPGYSWAQHSHGHGSDAGSMKMDTREVLVEGAALTQHALPRFAHSFTHFRLHIQPVKLQLSPRRTTPPGQIWLPLSDAFDAALPAPVRKLLAQIDHG